MRVDAKASGFSLIEVLISLAIIALISAVAIPSFTYVFRTSTESFSRQMASLLRESRDRALLNDKVLRVRYDLDAQQYWVEEGSSSLLLPPTLSEREQEAKDREAKEKKDKKETSSDYRMVNELTKKPKEVPNGLRIMEVISPRFKKPIKEGVADIYFFPNGTAEAAILKIEDQEKNKQSLVIHPITGSAKLVTGDVEESGR